VRRDVLAGLDRDLERVLDEATLADVALHELGPSHRTELGEVRLDERELLGDEAGIRHPAAPRARRYSSQIGVMSK
jgi:hypothetical protein